MIRFGLQTIYISNGLQFFLLFFFYFLLIFFSKWYQIILAPIFVQNGPPKKFLHFRFRFFQNGFQIFFILILFFFSKRSPIFSPLRKMMYKSHKDFLLLRRKQIMKKKLETILKKRNLGFLGGIILKNKIRIIRIYFLRPRPF